MSIRMKMLIRNWLLVAVTVGLAVWLDLADAGEPYGPPIPDPSDTIVWVLIYGYTSDTGGRVIEEAEVFTTRINCETSGEVLVQTELMPNPSFLCAPIFLENNNG